jgi:4-hydroxy-3-polyprenylbenzoate decarboxylase
MHGSAIRHALGAHLITSSRVWETVEKEVPNVVGVFSLYQQCQTGSEILVISLKQSYPGHAKHAALAALSSSSAIAMSRIVITVDEDIDPSNIEEVLWALVTRCDPSEDIDIIRGVPSTALNPRIPPEKRDLKDFTFSVMIVNACKPFAWKDTFPKSTILNPELRSKIMLKWGEKLNLK